MCWNCDKYVKVIETKEEVVVEGGALMVYPDPDDKSGKDKIAVYKCNECVVKHPELRNYQKCEVYSRVVGYIRPVQQWNPGKAQEFKERKTYEIKESKDKKV